jgi:hypothetical protein
VLGIIYKNENVHKHIYPSTDYIKTLWIAKKHVVRQVAIKVISEGDDPLHPFDYITFFPNLFNSTLSFILTPDYFNLTLYFKI